MSPSSLYFSGIPGIISHTSNELGLGTRLNQPRPESHLPKVRWATLATEEWQRQAELCSHPVSTPQMPVSLFLIWKNGVHRLCLSEMFATKDPRPFPGWRDTTVTTAKPDWSQGNLSLPEALRVLATHPRAPSNRGTAQMCWYLPCSHVPLSPRFDVINKVREYSLGREGAVLGLAGSYGPVL